MGTVDRAFIKAFEKKRPRPSPTGGRSGEPRSRTPHTATASSDAADRPVDSAPSEPRVNRSPLRIRKVARFELSANVRTLEQVARDQFEALSQILRRAQEQAGLKSLLFTSCYRGEGRTSLLVALARTLPRVVQARTVLVDADLLNPGIAGELGIDVPVGLDDIVIDGRSLEEALVVSQGDAFAVLPMRREVARAREFIRSDRLVRTIAQLRNTFDLVLVDVCPIFSSLDPTIMHEQIDGAILVVNREVTEDASVRRARHMMEQAGLTVLGIAETFT